MSVVDTLMTTFELDADEALSLVELVADADRAWTRALHGYPKDNKIPPPLNERLVDPLWRKAFVVLLEEEDEVDPGLVARVLRRMRDQ